jgi:quercetin dioxygenase-like cupin family protein
MVSAANQVDGASGVTLRWSDVDWLNPGEGVYFQLFKIGEGSDDDRAGMLIVEIPAHFEIPAHHHAVWHHEIILAGEIKVGNEILQAGDMRIVPAGAVYGPLKAGSEGCRLVEIFERSGQNDVDAIYADAELSETWPFRLFK